MGQFSLRPHNGDNSPMQSYPKAHPSSPAGAGMFPVLVFAVTTICGSMCLAANVSPSSTYLNQALALFGWMVMLCFGARELTSIPRRGVMAATVALALLAFASVLSFVVKALPSTLMLSALGLLAAASVALWVGAGTARSNLGAATFQAVCFALILAGTINLVVAIVQTFTPGWADGNWIARGTLGRAGGNLRQPNHLSSLLLWSMVSLVWCHEAWAERRGSEHLSLKRSLTTVLMAAMVFGVVLTVSRTGTVCILLLAVWGLLGKQLSRYSRVLLWLVPVAYVLFWLAMGQWAQVGVHDFAGQSQLHKSDLSSSRFGIWANTLALIAAQPWFGVGWGEFNLAWSLTSFPGRPLAFFDHTHNLPLQLLVELGVPLGTFVLVLLARALWKAFSACRTERTEERGSERLTLQAAFLMVLMMVVHSMLEYPLWYSYFLLPTAFALGVCLGRGGPESVTDSGVQASSPGRLRAAVVGLSLIVMVGTAVSLGDYLKVAAIFSEDEVLPLPYRIARGQGSLFFAHHADYAAATVTQHPSEAMSAFKRAPHLLLDTRLMTAWAMAYAEQGDIERARYIADRLREFRNPDSAEFFARCEKPRPPGAIEPFQCKPATRQFTYEDFKLR